MTTNIVAILIPGTTATWLMDGSNVAWGGKNSEVDQDVKAGNDTAAEQLLEGPLSVGTGSPLYKPFQSYFADQYGFKLTTITPSSTVPALEGRNLLTFEYDWRVDNTTTAGLLQSVLQQIDENFGTEPYETWLIGHSMGGLVARAVLESNRDSQESWFANISGLITLGTPHLGAPLALQGILNRPLPGIKPALETVVVTFINSDGFDDSFDSTYELLPPPQVKFITEKPGGAQLSAFDLQNAIISAGGSLNNFQGAQKFFTSVLTYTDPTPKPYYCAFGKELSTTCGFTYDTQTNVWTATLGSLGLGGDLIVPRTSAEFSGVTVQETQGFMWVDHFALAKNPAVLAQVAKWMKLAQSAERVA